MYIRTSVIVTNRISTYLYIQNHTARNLSIVHKFVNVFLIQSCKTETKYCLIVFCFLKIVKAILCKQGNTSMLSYDLIYNCLLSIRFYHMLSQNHTPSPQSTREASHNHIPTVDV